MTTKYKTYVIDKIGDVEIKLTFSSKKQLQEHLLFLNMCSAEIKKAIQKVKLKYKGNEENIGKIIYDRWGRYKLDGGGNPIM